MQGGHQVAQKYTTVAWLAAVTVESRCVLPSKPAALKSGAFCPTSSPTCAHTGITARAATTIRAVRKWRRVKTTLCSSVSMGIHLRHTTSNVLRLKHAKLGSKRHKTIRQK